MESQTQSVQGVRVRLTDERWEHIVAQHTEMLHSRDFLLKVVAAPEVVYEGPAGECLAVKELKPGLWAVVVYRIGPPLEDGFIITAYMTSRRRALDRWRVLWP